MERILKCLLIGIFYLHNALCSGQVLRVDLSAPQTYIGSESLAQPFTAGADFPSQLSLKDPVLISVEQIPPQLTWCLCAAFPVPLPAQMELALWPDLASFPPRTPGLNSSLQPTVLTPFYQPVFSHTGPLFQKSIHLFLRHATVLTAEGMHDLNILWQLREGPCNFP